MNLMFRDLYRSRPHLGMIYVAMKSLRRTCCLASVLERRSECLRPGGYSTR
jgi:hypothetical protein